jgi:methyl-accepting chemotaxis protein
MKWASINIRRKLDFGFGAILCLTAVIGVLSVSGVAGIIMNAERAIKANTLNVILAQKEVEHLKWVSKVHALLNDNNVTSLNVQSDDHKCGFGKWLYGVGRTEAESLVPSLAPLFDQIEKPHRSLHESTNAIRDVFQQADPRLPNLLAMREIDHLKWASGLRDTLLRHEDKLTVQTDSHKCKLGKWLNTKEARQIYIEANADFKKIWDQLLSEHSALHRSAIEIREALEISHEHAYAVYELKTLPLLSNTLMFLKELRGLSEHALHGMHTSNKIYSEQTLPALEKVQKLLKEIRTQAIESVMTNDTMFQAARETKRYVTILGVAALVIGLLIAFFIARGITSVIQWIAIQINEGAVQVASTASQVSSSSRSLAECSSEQAASNELAPAELRGIIAYVLFNRIGEAARQHGNTLCAHMRGFR